ncbi:unnamed protein product, partial [Rotaria magnacalcarata]
MWSNLTLK